MNSKELDKEIKAKIIRLLCAIFPNVKIYLYGSRARKTNRDRSDIDLAIDTGAILEKIRLHEAKSILI